MTKRGRAGFVWPAAPSGGIAAIDHEEHIMSKKQHRTIIETARTSATTFRAPLTAFAVAYLLSACGGSEMTAPPAAAAGGTVTPGPSPTPTTTTNATSGALTTLGSTASDLGGTISSTAIPGVSPAVSQGVGGTVSATGAVVDAAADAVSSGLGQIGSTPDPVGTTVAGLGSAVSATSGVVAGVASTVDALGTGPLAPLAPVTTPLAGALDTAANGIRAGGQVLGNTLASSAVQQVTQPLSSAITPLVVTLGQQTQNVGTTTGIGQPVSGLLGQVGGAVQSAGAQLAGASSNPLAADVGHLVSSVGNTVTNAGGLVNPNGPNGAAPIPGLITSLVGSSSASVQPGTGSSAGSGNPLAPVTGLLGGASGGSSPLSSLTGALGSAGGATNGTTPGTSSATSGVTSLFGGALPIASKLP